MAVVSGSRHHLRLGSRHAWKPRLQHETETMLLPGLLREPFSDALWDACHATFSHAVLGGRMESSHFHSSVVLSRIGPPQTSQPIQTPSAGGHRGTRRSTVFVLVMALLSTEMHDYFALCSFQPVHVVLIKALQQVETDLRGHPSTISMVTLTGCFFHITCLLTVTGGRLGPRGLFCARVATSGAHDLFKQNRVSS